MKSEKSRVVKPPEERRQEILDTAMQVFAEKGYEQTTMRDIAAAVGVVPGLCYRYFESKQVLFDTAVRQYIKDFCTPIVELLRKNEGCLEEALNDVTALFLRTLDKEKYHYFFHRDENKSFHILLCHYICDYLLPYFTDFFESLNKNNTVRIQDAATFSQFILFGQIPILNAESLSAEKKIEIIKSYITKMLLNPANNESC